MPSDRVDRLFTLPADEFIGERDALVGSLRKAGERDEASHVRRLRRPTLAAWAVNQAVRDDPGAYRALIEAGTALRHALRRAMSGASDAGVKEASGARRQWLQHLTKRAMEALDQSGRDPSPHRDDIAATFEAASADDEAASRVAAGRLSQPLPAPSGFGDLSPLTVGASAAAEDVGGTPVEDAEVEVSQKTSREREAAARAVTEARTRTQAASATAQKARGAADAASQGAQEAASEASRAWAEAERSRRAAERAQRRADTARQRVQKLEELAARAQATAEHLERGLMEAEQRLADP